jgi:AcrR family transcriptional regulator
MTQMTIEVSNAPSGGPRSEPRESARDRILRTACELFYRLGIRAVGVETIAAEAGTTKMSLYRNFESKDELVAEWLRRADADFWVWWDATLAPLQGQPRRQIETLFLTFESRACEAETERGCPLINAAVELTDPDHPAQAVILAHHQELRRRLLAMCEELDARDPENLTDALMLVMGGANMTRLILDTSGPLRAVSLAAQILLDSPRLGVGPAQA